jgi:hypothetical protein
MNTTTYITDEGLLSEARELDQRTTNNGVTITLWFDAELDAVGIDIEDDKTGDAWTVGVRKDEALDAFRHPFFYLAQAQR